MAMPDMPKWYGDDGSIVSCTEKIKVMNENMTELFQLAQDAFEDALLMGCGTAARIPCRPGGRGGKPIPRIKAFAACKQRPSEKQSIVFSDGLLCFFIATSHLRNLSCAVSV